MILAKSVGGPSRTRASAALFAAFLGLGWLSSVAVASAEDLLIFSPSGNSVKKTISFGLEIGQNSGISHWTFDIREKSGRLVKRFEGDGAPPDKITWDGKNADNQYVVDGVYLFSLSLVTPSGNSEAIPPSQVIVDRVPPLASATVQPKVFSPTSATGKNEAEFDLEGSDKYGIYEWLLLIKDANGAPARNFGGKAAPPRAVRWDGKGDFQEDLPDGTYSFSLTVVNIAGTKVVTPPGRVAIKRTGVASAIEISPRVIAPSGNGYPDHERAAIHISAGAQEGIDSWKLAIINAGGRTVKLFHGKGLPPEELHWDGHIEDKLAPDGPYHAVLSETDVAGNTASSPPAFVDVDDTPPQVALSISPAMLAPGGDGFEKFHQTKLHAAAASAQPLDSWSIKILNDVGQPVKTWTGTRGSAPHHEYPWKGHGDDGNILVDGLYSGILEATDIAGNRAKTLPQKIQIDRTPPQLSVQADAELFSPSVRPEVKFDLSIQDASPIGSWELLIKNAAGKTVKTYRGGETAAPPAQLGWNGADDAHVPLPDGSYAYILKAADILGNHDETQPKTIVIGGAKPVAEASSKYPAISPNGNGAKDSTVFSLSSKSYNAVKDWKLVISNAAGPVRTFEGQGDVPGEVSWAGDDDQKRVLADGVYQYSLRVEDAAGNVGQSAPKKIIIDTGRPDISISASAEVFAPLGKKKTVGFYLTYKDLTPVSAWKMTISDRGHKPVKTFSGTTEFPATLAWNGLDDSGAALPDGVYTYVLSATDDVGNSNATAEQMVRLENAPPEVTLAAQPLLFAPGTNSAKNQTVFQLDAKDPLAGFASWKLSVTNAKDNVLAKNFAGLGRPPKSFPWDGRTGHGVVVPDGRYVAQLLVTNEVGTTGKSAPLSLAVDTSKPTVHVKAQTESLAELVPQISVTQDAEKDIVISLASEILFDVGRAEIKPGADATLMKAVDLIRRYKDRAVRIEGHADNTPIHNDEFANNKELSEARAKAVKSFFADKGGIDPSRMTAKGYGAAKPKASNDTAEGRKANRRVEIILLKGGKPS